jgi:hypothetical protein
MFTIHKFVLTEDKEEIELPDNAEILTVQNNRGKLCMWVKLDPIAPKIKRYFQIIGTGHKLSDIYYKYIGTVQLDRAEYTLVWHVFEWIPKKE